MRCDRQLRPLAMSKTTRHSRRPAASTDANPAPESNSRAPSRLRTATAADLEAVNRVIESAIDGWKLPPRVKRISLPLYRYHEQDLDFLRVVLVETDDTRVVAVASWETECREAGPAGQSALFIHGLYVTPGQQRRGLGSRLLQAAESAAANRCDGLLVKAQPGAGDFFSRHGFEQLAVTEPGRDYPYRYWKQLPAG